MIVPKKNTFIMILLFDTVSNRCLKIFGVHFFACVLIGFKHGKELLKIIKE